MNNQAIEDRAIEIIANHWNDGMTVIQSALKAEGFTLHSADGKQHVHTADGVEVCAFEIVQLSRR